MLLKGCQENPGQDSSYGRLYGGGRRLRHLLPRPSPSITKKFAPCCPISSGYCSCAHSNKYYSMNHQQTSAADDHAHSRKEETHMEHMVSSRWNPTPEQLMALEEMYRRGVRTPSSEEIKLIAAKLRQFGKIEGKNVFYWFQNHKARERQKRRRQPEPSASNKLGNDQETLEQNDTGFRRKDLEAQDKNRLIASIKEPMVAEEGEILQHLKSQRRMAKDSSVASDIFINATNSSGNQQNCMFSSSSAYNVKINKEEGETRHTLELFPLQKDGPSEREFKELCRDSMIPSCAVPPNQFYEFL